MGAVSCLRFPLILYFTFWAILPAAVGFLDFANNFLNSFSGFKDLASPSGIQTLFSRQQTNVILTLDTPMTPIIREFAQMSFLSRDDKATALVSALQAASIASQAPILQALRVFNVHAEPYWLTNQIYVKAATPFLLQTLAQLAGIRNIMEDLKLPIIPIFNETHGTPPNGTLWNVKKVNAHKVWREGVRGEGILVAGIDTGVRGTHSTLKDNYLGSANSGWYDPLFHTREPNDMQGHGTHTMGTIVGRNGIGAAPRAKWMACKGCGVQSCHQHALLACGQWVLCPTSRRNNCTNVPHIVSNSWGGPGGQTWYDDVINAWKAAGILPIFANGNHGPKCETAGSPGDSDQVIAIGATDINDKLAKFSSRGPKIVMGDSSDGMFGKMMPGSRRKTTDTVKPDISAPGENINSAGIISDNAYKVLSGTSMATPLTSGAVALLVSVNPNLTIQELKDLLFSTAVKKLPLSESEQCGAIPETEFPNHMYGHGRLDIYKAFKKMISQMDKDVLERRFDKRKLGDKSEKWSSSPEVEDDSGDGRNKKRRRTKKKPEEGYVSEEEH